ncbi:hypothetical protein QFC21_005653 [Naganishia friedmannii]|uniref:Uncharacterized protein n=1 Tax=Naganishia friedmannii TaxID=89922 RepID=A0ACC2V7L5_9TREE|nr:hypothetical protein QFC21_005653 [Naganishia friedmannii]
MAPSTNSPRIVISDPTVSSPPNVLVARSPRAIKSQDPVAAGISTSPLAFTTLGPSVLGSGIAGVGTRNTQRDREREREIEAENRERQRAQDLESAMSMSRARSNSVVTPLDGPPLLKRGSRSAAVVDRSGNAKSSGYHSSSPIDESPFPMLSEHEEAELAHARRISFGRGMHEEEEDEYPALDDHHEADDDFLHESRMNNDIRVSDRGSDDDERQRGHFDRERYEHRRRKLPDNNRQIDDEGVTIHEESSHEGSMRRQQRQRRRSDSRSPTRSANPSPRLLAQTAGLGMGMGQLMGGMGPVRNHFDFAPMEEFAGKEKESLMQGMGGLYGRWNGLGDGLGLGEEQNTERPSVEHRTSLVEGDLLVTAEGPSSYDSNGGRVVGGTTIGDGESQLGTSPPIKPEDTHLEPESTFTRRRQRKLSNTNPTTRRQGRLALFEGLGGGLTEDPARGESYTVHVHDHPGLNGFSSALPTKAPRKPFPTIASGIQGKYSDYPDGMGPPVGRERPYRFSFYSNALPATIHARSLSELPSDGQTFGDLFSGRPARKSSTRENNDTASFAASRTGSGAATPVTNDVGPKSSLLARAAAHAADKPTKGVEDDGETQTWWLDVLSPTDEEMRMLAKVFGIHPLTTEDILLEETREKIELFRNYYLVCFRSFDQDPYSQTYLEPLNMYIIVFREGTLSFHFRGTPHPQNVRRRIKSLKDYISVTSDWISYALIDDITDAFGPLIQSIEYEVDGIDELVLILKEAEQSDMLRRIGTCRKKVMGLLRLMGNKADVVKGLAKRCNENWSVAPKSDIGLYLSDIQDHLITMTQNLNHYEKILSRSHSNYLAQISIEMTDANNQINDVLSPMNLVTGLWGMNVHVPGQEVGGYAWFGGILGCLALFAIFGAWITLRIFVKN